MPVIRILPPQLANQIAAGEVVERPASVVKELVENAIDAGATRISVTTEVGGKSVIRVEDDGEGMTAEDARLALERHATSKIGSAEDLAGIRTLGFRGEALPSIASVSHFTLRTRRRGEEGGTEIRVDGGTVASIKTVGAPEGTSIEVRDLFYNLPARRKFLKSDVAESAQISRIVTQFALGYPEVGFTLQSGARRTFQHPPVASLRDRFYQIFGERPELIELTKEAAGLRLYGLVAALAEQGPVRGPQNVFVNRRIVRDRTISHAITHAYSTATIKERSPEVHLFFEMAPERVDVNVHPTKAEVRFLESSLVHEVLRRALMDTLGTMHVPELQLHVPAPPRTDAHPQALPGVFADPTLTRSIWAPSPGAGAADGTAIGGSAQAGSGQAESMSPGGTPGTGWMPEAGAFDPEAPFGRVGTIGPQPGLVQRQTVVDATHPLVPLGQFRDTFIVAIDAEGISLIDQHVAHERILFEQVMDRLTRGTLESQRLLDPVLIELSAEQRQSLQMHEAELARLGFELAEFGGDSVRIAAVPALLRFEEAAAAVRALAEDLEGLDRGGRVDEALRRIAATMACHAAVKAHAPLTFEKMQHILNDLRRTAYSTVCPHGRPVLLRITRREIERNFQRG